MAFLFANKKSKSPVELVKITRENMLTLKNATPGQSDKTIEKAQGEVTKGLQSMKMLLYGTEDSPPNQEVVANFAKEMYNTNALVLLVDTINLFEFEAKKDCAVVFNNLLRRRVGNAFPTVEYIYKHAEVLERLVDGYEDAEIALNCGSMLRECIQYESLAKVILYSDQFFKFFEYVELTNFDLASDAFATFKDLLTTHKTLSADFLENNYDQFFEKYTELLHSKNYVTRRQSLKLLGELLLDRPNFNIMTRYISEKQNLRLMMNMLRDKSKSIQFEAFHVFKVFVANPNKAEPIRNILVRNKDKLSNFLKDFQNDRGGEEDQFAEEKAFLLKQIAQMQ